MSFFDSAGDSLAGSAFLFGGTLRDSGAPSLPSNECATVKFMVAETKKQPSPNKPLVRMRPNNKKTGAFFLGEVVL